MSEWPGYTPEAQAYEMRTRADKAKGIIEEAHKDLTEASEMESEFWSQLGVAWDTAEAENAGYLEGYRDALGGVLALMNHGDEANIAEYVKDVLETARRRNG